MSWTDIETRDIVGLALVAATVALSIVAYPQLPEEMATQFGVGGEPGTYTDRWIPLTVFPVLTAAIVVLFKLLPVIDPLGDSYEKFSLYFDLTAILVAATVAYAHALVVFWNLGYEFDVGQVLAPMLAVLFVALGFVLENAEQNWFVGIRTPWTLSDEEVWKQTHDQGGTLFKGAGLVVLLAIPFPQYFLYLVLIPTLIAAFVPTVYSYVLYRRKQETR